MKVPDPGRFHIPNQPVAVEYDCRGQRKTKVLPNAFQAKAFFIGKDKANKNPKIVKQPNRFVGNADDFTIIKEPNNE